MRKFVFCYTIFLKSTLLANTCTHISSDQYPKICFFFDHAPYISPKIIEHFCCLSNESEDQVVAIDILKSISSNQYIGKIKHSGTCVSVDQGDLYPLHDTWYEYIGQTEDGICIIKRGGEQEQSILLFEFHNDSTFQYRLVESENLDICQIMPQENETIVLKKLCEIPLNKNWDMNVKLEGNTLFVGNLGELQIESKYSRKLRTLLQNLLNPIINADSLPCYLDAMPYINPKIIANLMTSISDRGNRVVAHNLSDSLQAATYRRAEDQVDQSNTSIHLNNQDSETFFRYEYIGQVNQAIHILKTTERYGGSGFFVGLLMVGFEYDYGMTVDWNKGSITQNKKRCLIKKHADMVLEDRWMGALKLEENRLLIGPNEGILAPVSENGELLVKTKFMIEF
ncbi:MAG: hypothetical protein H0T62_05365 [Parachlamydiaceae bacterium]|nr:hypothetical protein [Parachlamydiaceae bacterium]